MPWQLSFLLLNQLMSGNRPPCTFCSRALHAFDERLVVSLKERVTKHSLFHIRVPIVMVIALFT
jgi:hypothetical protein